MIGIYKITNKTTGKVYIGQSNHIDRRILQHYNHAKNNAYTDYYSLLHKAIRKYGEDDFEVEVIEECSEEELNDREMHWINYYRSYVGFEDCNGYNATLGGDHSKQQKLMDNQVEEIKRALLTTRISQTQIAEQFGVSQVMVSEINQGKSWRDEDLDYPLRSKKWKEYTCIDCGATIYKGATRCVKCAKEAQRKVGFDIRPSRDELEKLLFENKGNFTKVGKMFDVNGNSVRKWCNKEGLPTHSSDYKPQKKEKLPPTEAQPIAMCDKDTGEILEVFPSGSEARRQGYSHAPDVANGKRKTDHGFSWKWLDN